MKQRKTLTALVLITTLTLPLVSSLAQTCSTVVVTGANLSGWAFQLTSPDGAAEFVEPAPATPPAGQGAAYLFTGTNGDASAQIRNANYNGTPISSLSSLSYCTYVEQWNTTVGPGQVPYIIINVDTDNDSDVDELLFFEPLYSDGSYNPSITPQPVPVLNTWQCWDAFNGGWYAIDANTGSPTYGGAGTGVLPLSGYTTLNPSAVIRNAANGRGGLRILSGFASPSDVFEAYVDRVQVGTSAGCTVFDFEKFSEPATADQCKKGGWQTLNPDRPAGPFKNQGDCVQYVNAGK